MDGFHVPVTPFKDVVGKSGIEAPVQYGPAVLNSGTVFGVIIIVREAVVAHCPELGVKVYAVVALLFIEGLHVPVILFKEVVGKAGIEEPAQYGPGVLKEGVIAALIVIVSVVWTAHCPDEGVNV